MNWQKKEKKSVPGIYHHHNVVVLNVCKENVFEYKIKEIKLICISPHVPMFPCHIFIP